MITREEIRSIPELHKLIERKRAQLVYLSEKATAVPSGISDVERVQRSITNTAGKYSDAAADTNMEIIKLEAELTELKHGASMFIDTLNKDTETQRLTVKVLKYRYLKCYTWDDVSELTGYQQRYIQRLEHDIIDGL